MFQVGRRRMSWTTAAYHAGQTTSERSRIQKKFMSGKIRVLIATCAFGMGLNKPDLQAVIHFSLTKSFENYVQVSQKPFSYLLFNILETTKYHKLLMKMSMRTHKCRYPTVWNLDMLVRIATTTILSKQHCHHGVISIHGHKPVVY